MNVYYESVIVQYFTKFESCSLVTVIRYTALHPDLYGHSIWWPFLEFYAIKIVCNQRKTEIKCAKNGNGNNIALYEKHLLKTEIIGLNVFCTNRQKYFNDADCRSLTLIWNIYVQTQSLILARARDWCPS